MTHQELAIDLVENPDIIEREIVLKNMSQRFEFTGLREHSHRQRTNIINKLIVPRIKKELGKNLIAIAACGSYARDEDTSFSDIELVIFVKEKKNLPWGFGKIVDGILIEGAFSTEDDYYKTTIEPNKEWFVSGSDKLKAITNPDYVKKLNKYRVKNLSAKCFRYAKDVLFEVQESFGKLFTAIEKKNTENLFPVLADAVMQTLKLMAFINKTPYKTLGTFITQARTLSVKPRGFDEFMSIIVDGSYTDLKKLERSATVLFAGIEDYFEKKTGQNIYDSDLSTIIKKR